MWLKHIDCTIKSRADSIYKPSPGLRPRRVAAGVISRERAKMPGTEITFHNKVEIKVQAQIFTGGTLVSTCVAGPGETGVLPAESGRYDIYLRNGATGWVIARQMDSEAKSLTLIRLNGKYTIT